MNTSSHSSLDFPQILARFSGMESVAIEMFRVFLQKSPELMEGIRSAIRGRDFSSLEMSAHSLRGSLTYLLAENAILAAEKLERCGAKRDLDQAGSALAELEKEYSGIVDALTTWLASNEAAS